MKAYFHCTEKLYLTSLENLRQFIKMKMPTRLLNAWCSVVLHQPLSISPSLYHLQPVASFVLVYSKKYLQVQVQLCTTPPQICDAAPPSLELLLQHAKEHTAAGSLTCALCGLALPSVVALTLHQLVWRPGHDKEQEVLNPVRLGEGTGGCPACGTDLENEQMEKHRVLHCESRSSRVKSRVARLVQGAEEQGLAPLLVVGQEVEAALEHLASLGGAGYREEWQRAAREAERRYGLLPEATEALSWAPEGLQGRSDKLLDTFPLWERVQERVVAPGHLGEVEAGLEEVLARVGEWGTLPQDPVLKERPEAVVLGRLEAELGWGLGETAPLGLEAVLQGLQGELALVK